MRLGQRLPPPPSPSSDPLHPHEPILSNPTPPLFCQGSTLAIHGYARDAARAAVTTTLAAAAAATAGLLLKRGLPGRLGGSLVWDLGHTCNSLLGGLVSITAGSCA